MKVPNKLLSFFSRNGISKSWFGKKLGISPQQMSHIIHGVVRTATPHWKTVSQLTRGDVTLADMVSDKYAEFDFIEIEEGSNPHECIMRIKQD